jgi:O-antigen ligase
VRGSGSFGRLLAAVLGGLMVVSGLAAVSLGGTSASVGVWLVVVGLALIIAALVERLRYRSESAEASGLPGGPGGGEPTNETLETRFRRTDESFIDPTSGRRMRVWLDGTSGERRYRAED